MLAEVNHWARHSCTPIPSSSSQDSGIHTDNAKQPFLPSFLFPPLTPVWELQPIEAVMNLHCHCLGTRFLRSVLVWTGSLGRESGGGLWKTGFPPGGTVFPPTEASSCDMDVWCALVPTLWLTLLGLSVGALCGLFTLSKPISSHEASSANQEPFIPPAAPWASRYLAQELPSSPSLPPPP